MITLSLCEVIKKVESSHQSHIISLEEDNFLEFRRYMFQKKGQMSTSSTCNTFPLDCSALNHVTHPFSHFLNPDLTSRPIEP